MALSCIQSDAKTFLLEQVKKEKSGVVNNAANIRPKYESGNAVSKSTMVTSKANDENSSNTSADKNNGKDE